MPAGIHCPVCNNTADWLVFNRYLCSNCSSVYKLVSNILYIMTKDFEFIEYHQGKSEPKDNTDNLPF